MTYTMKRFAVGLWGIGLVLLLAGDVLSQTLGSRAKIPSGYWQVSETYTTDAGEQNSIWSFELVDDNSPTIVAVGKRRETNGERVQDRSIAIIFIDKHDNGTLSGTYIETYGDGEQAELNLTIVLGRDGTEILMAAHDANGKIVSKFDGVFIGEGTPSEFEEGKWTIREIVSPVNGKYDIEWAYEMKEQIGGRITGRGNKSIVNGRKAYPGELKTFCNITLKREGKTVFVTGTGVEVNPKGRKYTASYDGWISPSGRSFILLSIAGKSLSAIYVGRYVDDR